MVSIILSLGVVAVLIIAFVGVGGNTRLQSAFGSLQERFNGDTLPPTEGILNGDIESRSKLDDPRNQRFRRGRSFDRLPKIFKTPGSGVFFPKPQPAQRQKIKVPQRRNLTNVSNLDPATVLQIERDLAGKKFRRTTITSRKRLLSRKTRSRFGSRKTIQGTLDTLARQEAIAKRNRVFQGTNNFANPNFATRFD